LVTHWEKLSQPHQHRGDQFTDRTYAANQVAAIKSTQYKEFISDISAIDTNLNGAATFTLLGPNDGADPVCCLFTQPKLGGNVWCMSVGGGNALPQWKDDGIQRYLTPLTYAFIGLFVDFLFYGVGSML